MKLFSFKSMRSRLTYWFLMLALVPLMAALTITYFQRVQVIYENTFDKLTAIRDLKVDRLRDWLIRKARDIKIIASDQGFAELETVVTKTTLDRRDREVVEKCRDILNRYMSHYLNYIELFIINPGSGKIIVATSIFREGMDQSDNDYFTRPLQSRELYIQDVYFSKSLAQYTMTYSYPIFCRGHKDKHITGIMVAHINLCNTLFRTLLNRVGLGKTGETLLVNKDVIALNELRWHANAPLNLQIKAKPATYAAQGETGIIITEDYREEDVLAAYTYIPETDWGFVCKQDMSEINAPIHQMILNFIFLFVFTTVIISILSVYISNSISKPIDRKSVV